MNKYRITYPNNKEVREYKSRTTKDIDNEALRVAKLIKYDKPAFSWRDEPIECVYYLPIKFTLHPKKPKKWWQFWRE